MIPGSGRSPGGGHGNPLQCSCLGNPMDRGAWRAAVHGVTKDLDMIEHTARTQAGPCPAQDESTDPVLGSTTNCYIPHPLEFNFTYIIFSHIRACVSIQWEDPLEKEMAIRSNILAWRIPMVRGAWRAAFHGVAESDVTEQLPHMHIVRSRSGI